MSRVYGRRPTTESCVESITCDVCSKLFQPGIDDEEIENCIFIVKTYGYGSKHFGDMTTINIDICEDCASKMFGHMTEGIFPQLYPSTWYSTDTGPEDLTYETADATITIGGRENANSDDEIDNHNES